MKTSKLVLGMGTLVLAALPAHAQMVGAGTQPNAPMAMVASTLSTEHTAQFETVNVNQFPKHEIKPVTTKVFPTATNAPSAHFQVTTGAFKAPNYTAPSVRFQVNAGRFTKPNYVAPSVKTQVAAAGFAAPNFVAPSVKTQVTGAGFAAPNYVAPSMSQQIASASFPVPVRAGGSAEWSK
ncbi:MAG: hypothetical protein WB795_18890 [Candidatus Acidiferrales bacterium]|jgi:hypothetical protein